MITAVTIAVAAYCLWVRRGTWRYGWELGSSIAVVGMLACMLLMTPGLSLTFSAPIHALTGVWNLEDLVGHLAYLMALTALTHTLTSRLDLDNPKLLLRRRLELPITIMTPLLVGLFLLGNPKTHVPDLFQAPGTVWLTVYWAALCGSASYLLAHLWAVLLRTRRDPRATTTANIYLAAITIDGCCVTSVLASRIVPAYPHALTWLLLCAAVCGYVIAPAYSWRRKSRPPLGRPLESGPIEPGPALPA